MRGIGREEGPGGLRLDLPAAHSAARMARRMVTEYAASRGVPDRELTMLEFVAGELLDNAVDHGGGGGAREVAELVGDVRMRVAIHIAGAEWTVRVEDQGGGDPARLSDLLEPKDPGDESVPDLEDERGRGLFLLCGLVDRLHAEATPGGVGVTLVARHRFRSEPEADSGPLADDGFVE